MDIETLLFDAEERMEKALVALERDFGKLRTGRATTSLVDNIKVDYYGAMTPVSQLASVAVPDSRTVTIQPWDKGAFSLVEKAILKSDLGLTPMNDGRIIRITVPPLTEERRKDLTKGGHFGDLLADESDGFRVDAGAFFASQSFAAQLEQYALVLEFAHRQPLLDSGFLFASWKTWS